MKVRIAALLLLLPFFMPADAHGDQALQLPALDGLVLDGRLDDGAWARAARLPADAVEVPEPAPATDQTRSLRPDVRLAVAAGRLWIGVSLDEDPGTSIGVHLLIAPDGANSVADAVSLGYRPLEVRAPRFAVRGPRGIGRGFYRLEGAADWTKAGRWQLEASVPVADLALPAPTTSLRLAVVVFTRTPNVVSAAPSGLLWSAPDRWLEVLPPEGGWPQTATVDDERLAREDQADRARRLAWLAFLKGSSVPIRLQLSRKKVLSHLRELLLDPLDDVLRHQPDLRVPVLTIRGDMRQRLGQAEEAKKDLREVLRLAPGWREAGYALHVRVLAAQLSEEPVGGASDFDTALARIDSMLRTKKFAPYARDGVELARGLLLYKHGDFLEAIAAFEPLVARYSQEPFIAEHAELARRGAEAANRERRRLAKSETSPLPRATVKTTVGAFVIELFHDEAPNSVNNFVWLGRHGFYDGLAIHRTLPFFLAQMGDPCTRGEGKPAGLGTPGYAIRSEISGRGALRGMVGLANVGRDTEGSQFFVLTGSGLHIEREASFFGRVVEGLSVVDRLKQGDRIEAVTFEGLDPERPYRPTTVAGRPAPDPVDDCPGG